MDDYKKKIHSVEGDYIEPEDLLMESDVKTYRHKSLEDRLEYYKTERIEYQKILYETKSKIINKSPKSLRSHLQNPSN